MMRLIRRMFVSASCIGCSARAGPASCCAGWVEIELSLSLASSLTNTFAYPSQSGIMQRQHGMRKGR